MRDMHPVLAYIDAGSGSLIIQAVIATIVAIPFFFRSQIGRAVRFVRGRSAGESSTSTADDNSRAS
jgi:hypothetical protein